MMGNRTLSRAYCLALSHALLTLASAIATDDLPKSKALSPAVADCSYRFNLFLNGGSLSDETHFQVWRSETAVQKSLELMTWTRSTSLVGPGQFLLRYGPHIELAFRDGRRLFLEFNDSFIPHEVIAYPDGSNLLVSGAGGILVIDAQSGNLLRSRVDFGIGRYDRDFRHVALSTDGTMIAAVRYDGRGLILRSDSLNTLAEFNVSTPRGLMFSLTGQWLYVLDRKHIASHFSLSSLNSQATQPHTLPVTREQAFWKSSRRGSSSRSELSANWIWGSNALLRNHDSWSLISFNEASAVVTELPFVATRNIWADHHSPILAQINQQGLLLWHAAQNSSMAIPLPTRWKMSTLDGAIDTENGVAFLGLGRNEGVLRPLNRENQTLEAQKARQYGKVVVNGWELRKNEFPKMDERGSVVVIDLKTEMPIALISVRHDDPISIRELIWNPRRSELIVRSDQEELFYKQVDLESYRASARGRVSGPGSTLLLEGDVGLAP